VFGWAGISVGSARISVGSARLEAGAAKGCVIADLVGE
jgi:hypothetical protein